MAKPERQEERPTWTELVLQRKERVQQVHELSKRIAALTRDDPARKPLAERRDEMQLEISALKEEIETRAYERQFAERIFLTYLEKQKKELSPAELRGLADRAWSAAEEFYFIDDA